MNMNYIIYDRSDVKYFTTNLIQCTIQAISSVVYISIYLSTKNFQCVKIKIRNTETLSKMTC